MWHGDWSAADWAWMSMAMLAFWAVVIAGVVWLIRTAGRGPDDHGGADRHDRPPDRPSARDILDERYARGELSDEEYRARRDTLSGR